MTNIDTAPANVTMLRRYSDLSPLPSASGPDVQRQMASLKVRLIARYKLHAVPGRPEELEQNGGTGKLISLGYGCKTIRIRKHNGREWTDWIDLQIQEGWHAEVYAFLDRYFDYSSPALLA